MNLSLHSELDRLDSFAQRPDHIAPNHWQEWVIESGVDPGIVALNVRSLVDLEIDPLTHEVVATPIHDLLNWKFTRFGQQVKAEMRGWTVDSFDPISNCPMKDWAQVKLDQPRLGVDGRGIKYEATAGVKPRAIFLNVPFRTSIKTLLLYGEKNPEAQEHWLQRFRAALANAAGQETSEAAIALHGAAERGQYQEIYRLLCRNPKAAPRDGEGAGRGFGYRGSIDAGLDASVGGLEDAGYWDWVRTFNLPVVLTEGAKKAGAELSLGCPAIALPGITMGVRTKDDEGEFAPSYLIPEIAHFATKGREILICFDYETKPRTIRNIATETEKLGSLLGWAGCTVKVISLPGPEKGVDDFIVAHGAAAFHDCYQKAISFPQWQISQYTRLSYKPSLELNQQYLGKLEIPADAKLICVKSPKGTGKTESLVEIVAQASQSGQRVLFLTHRVQLGQSLCDRVGLPYVTELRTSEAGAMLGYGVCVDSLHPESQARFNADHWEGAIVIIDECEQVLWHLLAANTEVRQHRIAILRQLRRLLINTLESEGGRVILCDADLSDLSIDFIRQTVQAKVEPWIVVNHWQPDLPWQVYNYTQTSPIEWYKALVEAVEAGGHHLICTHAQRLKGIWSTQTLEADLRKRFPGKRILRIDSESISEPGHPAFCCISHLNEILGDYDIVLASPSVETGVSIDIKGHFTAVWGCFQGCAPENTVRQTLARLREPVERHIWINRRGLGKEGNGALYPKSLISSEQKMARANMRLVECEYDVEAGRVVSHDASLDTWAKMAARINIGKRFYREAVIHGLRQEGHQVTEIADKADRTEFVAEVKAVQQEAYQADCEAQAGAEDLPDSEAEKLKSQKTKTKEERNREKKYNIQQRYGIDVTAELIMKDDRGWFSQIRMYYYLAMGRQYLQERDRVIADAAMQSQEMWLPTFNRSQLGVRVGALEWLGVPGLLQSDREFRAADPELLELASRVKARANDLRDILGITFSQKDTPIAIVQKLLGKLGQRLKSDRREGPRGKSVRVYVYHPAEDGRNEVYLNWLERDQLKRSESAVTTPGINRDLDGVATEFRERAA